MGGSNLFTPAAVATPFNGGYNTPYVGGGNTPMTYYKTPRDRESVLKTVGQGLGPH